MFSAKFSRSTCVENLFKSMVNLEELTPELSRQIIDLFAMYFPEHKVEEEDGTLTQEDMADMKEELNAPLGLSKMLSEKPGQNRDTVKIQLDQKMEQRSKKFGMTQTINQQHQRPREKKVQQINPCNMRLITSFFNFVGNCRFPLDIYMSALLMKTLSYTFELSLTGFKDCIKAKQIFLTSVTNSIEAIFKNLHLQDSVSQKLQDFLSFPNSAFYRMLQEKLNRKSGSLKQTDLQEIFAVIKLTKFLKDDRKKLLLQDVLDKIFIKKHEQSGESISQESDPQESNFEFSHSLDHHQKKLYLSLVANLISHQVVDQPYPLEKLHVICLQALKKFIGKQLSLQDFIVPYWPLLLQIAAVQDSSGKNTPQPFLRRVTSQNSNSTSPNEQQAQLPVCDLFVVFVKATMDKTEPIVRPDEMRHFIAGLFETLDRFDGSSCQLKEQSLLKTMDTMAVFCTQAKLQQLNVNILESLAGEYSLLNESMALSTDSQPHQQTSLKKLYKNLKGSSLFEQAIFALVDMELRQSATKQSIELSASFKFIQKVSKFIGGQQAKDDAILNQIQFALELLSKLVATGQTPTSLLNIAMQLTEKLFQCAMKLKVEDRKQLLVTLEQCLDILLVKLNSKRDRGVTAEFEFFLSEFQKLFTKQKTLPLLSPVSVLVLQICKSGAQSIFHFLQVQVEVLQDLCLEQNMVREVAGFDWEKLLSLVTESLCSLKDQNPVVYAEQAEEFMTVFLQLWFLLALHVRQNQEGGLQDQLAEFSAVTPPINYDKDFLLLSKAGHSKKGMTEFFKYVLSSIKEEKILSGKSSQTIYVDTTIRQTFTQQNLTKSVDAPKPKQNFPGEEDIDIEDLINSEPVQLSFSEKTFLSFFIYLSTLRIKSLKLMNNTCSTFTENLILVFSSDTLLSIADDAERIKMSMGQVISETPPLQEQLKIIAKELFDAHLKKLYALHKEKDRWSSGLEDQVTSDFLILMKACCNVSKQVRSLAQSFLAELNKYFPTLLLKPAVMAGCLDLLSALMLNFNDLYDSLASEITLMTTEEKVLICPDDQVKYDIVLDLTKLLTQMMTGAVILTDKEHLKRIFDSYNLKFEASLRQSAMGEMYMKSADEPFGRQFFTKTLEQLDLNKTIDLHSLRMTNNADVFSRKVAEIIPQVYPDQSVLNLAKQRMPTSVEALQRTNPFLQTPRCTLTLPMSKCQQIVSDSKISDHELFNQLIEKAMGSIARIDWVTQMQTLLDTPIMVKAKSDPSVQGIINAKNLQKMTEKFLQQISPDWQQEVNANLLNMISGDYKIYLAQITADLLLHLGCLLALHDRIPANKENAILRSQILQTVLLLPSGASSSESSSQSFAAVLTELVVQESGQDIFATKQLIKCLPLCFRTMTQKMPLSQTPTGDVLASSTLKLKNRLKQSINALQVEETQFQIFNGVNNKIADFAKFFKNKQQWTSLNLQVFPSVKCNPKSAVYCLISVAQALVANFFAIEKLVSKEAGLVDSLAHAILILIETGYKLIRQTQKVREALRMHLTLLKLGHLLLGLLLQRNHCDQKAENGRRERCMKITELISSYTMDFFTMHKIDFKRKKMNKLQHDVQLLDELMILSMSNAKRFESQTVSIIGNVDQRDKKQVLHHSLEAAQVGPRIKLIGNQYLTPRVRIGKYPAFQANSEKKISLANTTLTAPSTFSVTTDSDAENIEETLAERTNYLLTMMQVTVAVSQHCLTWLEQSFYAWNYVEQMGSVLAGPSKIRTTITPGQVEFLCQRWPQLALKLCSRVGISDIFKAAVLPTVKKIIRKAPALFMKDPEGLKFFLNEQKINKYQDATKFKASLWKGDSPIRLLDFFDLKYRDNRFGQQLALKQLDYAEAKTVIFYLPQLFQSLRYARQDTTNHMMAFLVKKSQHQASIAHNLLWYCKVELEAELANTGRKVALPAIIAANQLSEDAKRLYKLLKNEHLSPVQMQFYETETNFFEKITSISGLLQPSQSKDEKKAKIREKLIEYNKEIPECVYLPTNQTCRVIGIVTGSGTPMQSAARVPILISFEVEDYTGPDNDPILQQSNSALMHFSKSARSQNFEIQSELQPQFSYYRQLLNQPDKKRVKPASPFSSPSKKMWRSKVKTGESASSGLAKLLHTHQFMTQTNKFSEENNVRSQVMQSLHGQMQWHSFNNLSSQVPKQITLEKQEQGGHKKGTLERLKRIQNQVHYKQSIHRQSEFADRRKSGRFTETLRVAELFIGGTRRSEQKDENMLMSQPEMQKHKKIISCIFKVNDDLRQDILALQVIKLFQKIFKNKELDLYVVPYKCISNRTGADKMLGGIIEVIQNTYSRDQLGKAFEINLYHYFLKKYGNENSERFRIARNNFIRSLAAYSIVSYILQIKDRHNGNIMIDEQGHLIHIDFGFIFDWSPGKDMRFESADFKFTQEFIDILGGNPKAEPYQLFIKRVVQGFLAVREYAQELMILIELMFYSGYPCFKPASLQNLQQRFKLELNPLEAAAYMRSLIYNAHDKWTTKVYDWIQNKQNKIVF